MKSFRINTNRILLKCFDNLSPEKCNIEIICFKALTICKNHNFYKKIFFFFSGTLRFPTSIGYCPFLLLSLCWLSFSALFPRKLALKKKFLKNSWILAWKRRRWTATRPFSTLGSNRLKARFHKANIDNYRKSNIDSTTWLNRGTHDFVRFWCRCR